MTTQIPSEEELDKKFRVYMLIAFAILFIGFVFLFALSTYNDYQFQKRLDASREEWKQLRLQVEADYERQWQQLLENYKEAERRMNEINNLTRELAKYNLSMERFK